jgi:diaminopimelate epimerase
VKLGFAKMTGAGNDFIVIDDRGNAIGDDARELAREMCRRRVSVGADGLILLVPSTRCDFRMRYFNADGSEADMCGNGGRCVARFAHDLGIVGLTMQFETRSGVHQAVVTDEGVRLSMAEPRAMLLDYHVSIHGQKFVVHRVNTGVPHAVMEVEDLETYPVVETGRALRRHDVFLPEGTNVDFVRVLDENRIALRTYERGVEDETLACGTGAVASAIVMAALKRVRPPVSVLTRGGDTLTIGFYMSDSGFCDVTLAGDAKVVYHGAIERSED